MLCAFLLVVGALLIFWFKMRNEKFLITTHPISLDSKKSVPFVPWSFPYIGHGLYIRLNVRKFLQACFKQYGGLFKIKVFRKTIVLVCDRKYALEFFRAKEEQFSFYGMLENMYFSPGFELDGLPMETISNLIRKSIVLKMDKVLPKIKSEAEILVRKVKSEGDVNIDLRKCIMRYTGNTSSQCFLGTDLTEETFEDLYNFTHLLNKGLSASFLLPSWMIRLFIQRRLDQLRRRIGKGYYQIIEEYRQNQEKRDSRLLRSAVDATNQHGIPLGNDEIGSIIACLLYTSTDNTSIGLLNTLLDLFHNPTHLELAKEEAARLLTSNNLNGIINSKYLHACVMETARTTSHVFSIARKPDAKVTIGDYEMGKADVIAIGGTLLHIEGTAADVFKDPEIYDPSRFIREGTKEPTGSMAIVTWGGGIHGCPGKVFAQYEIKMGMAMFIDKLALDLERSKIGQRTFFSVSGFAEQTLSARVRSL